MSEHTKEVAKIRRVLIQRRTSYKMWDDLYVELIHRTPEEMLEYIYSMLRSRRMFGTNTREGCARESLDQFLEDRREICRS